MSRLAKKPIIIPEKTSVTIEGTKVTVKGPQGTLVRQFAPVVSFKNDGKEMFVELASTERDHKPLLGTTVAHVKNMIAGVNTPFSKKLLIEGVGYKADAKGSTLNLSLGFSHPVAIAAPEGITVTTEKGSITISGIDKDAVGQFAAVVRSWKEPEPYKGKGIRYADEVIRRKQGKKTA